MLPDCLLTGKKGLFATDVAHTVLGIVGNGLFEFWCRLIRREGKRGGRRVRSLFFISKSMLMRDVFAALLRYGEFASQFHLRPLAIPRLGSYTDPTWTDRGHTAH